jgi:hypothetical protein
MTNDTPDTLKAALQRAGWPAREFRSHSAALHFAIDYLEHQQANGVSRASLHKEFEDLGFACNFNSFVVALRRAKVKAKSEKTAQPAARPVNQDQQKPKPQTGGLKEVSKTATDGRAGKPPKGEIPGFVSSEKSNPEKLREQLI